MAGLTDAEREEELEAGQVFEFMETAIADVPPGPKKPKSQWRRMWTGCTACPNPPPPPTCRNSVLLTGLVIFLIATTVGQAIVFTSSAGGLNNELGTLARSLLDESLFSEMAKLSKALNRLR